MKPHHFLMFAIAGLLIGCTQVERPKISSPVTLLGSKSTNNFAVPQTGFQEGSKIGTYITAAAAGLKQTSNYTDNAPFTASASGFTATNIFYPVDGGAIDIYAYAPYAAATAMDVDKMVQFTVMADQTNPENSDILWCKSANVVSGSTPVLVFDHKLSQIVVTLTAAPGVTLTSPTITIDGTLPTTKLNMADGTLDIATGVAQSIIPVKTSELQMYAIIIPQSVTKNTEFITVSNGSKTFKHTLTKDYTFKTGTSYTFEITVRNNNIDVTFTGSVNGWNPNGGTTTGDAI